MLILNLNIPVGIIVAIVAIFVFGCGFVAGYLFGSLSTYDVQKSAGEKTKAKPKGASAQ